MELVSLGKEVLQNIAEHAASYRFGQSALRQLDRTLWIVEKCARWAVPPPLDQDERPQPELVRPLPWVFFLVMLITLRVTRESISLANLVMGKPPLRSADVVMFIQSKRRYLRTLKYQGNRMMRARTSTQTQQPWYSGLNSLFELTMCFRRQSQNYGNNNTTRATNNDEVMVIKRNKRGHQDENTSVPNETTMDRLIEKMMIDLDAESDEDSSYTLTNATSPKSDRSENTESDQDTICQSSPPTHPVDSEISQTNGDNIHFSPNKNANSSSTPEKTENHYIKDNHIQENQTDNETLETSNVNESEITITESSENGDENCKLDENITETAFIGTSIENTNSEESKTCEDSALPPPSEEITLSSKEETEMFIKSEVATNSRRTPKKDHKIGNGRTVKSVPSKKKGSNQPERRNPNEAQQQRVLPSNSSF